MQKNLYYICHIVRIGFFYDLKQGLYNLYRTVSYEKGTFIQLKDSGMRWVLHGVCCIWLLGFGALNAQQPLRLIDCRRMAQSNLSGRQQNEVFQKAEALRDALLKRLVRPELWGYGLASYQNEVPNPVSALEYAIDFRPVSKEQFKAGLFYTQRIYDGGDYKARKALSESETALARGETDAAQFRVEQSVDDLFLHALLAEKGAEILHLQMELLEKQLSDCRALFAEGRLFAKEILEIEAALGEVALQKGAFEADNRTCRAVLAEMCGIPADSGRSLEVPLLGALPERRVDPAFETLETLSQRNLLSLRQAKTAVLPKAYLFGTAGYGKTGFDLFDNRPDFYAGGGLFVKVPLTAWRDLRHEERLHTLKNELLHSQRSDLEKQQRWQEKEHEGEAAKFAGMVKMDSLIIAKRVEARRQSEVMFAQGQATVTDCLTAIHAESSARLQKEVHALEQIRALLKRDHILVSLPNLPDE